MDSGEDLVPVEDARYTRNLEMSNFHDLEIHKPWQCRICDPFECCMIWDRPECTIVVSLEFEFYIFANGFHAENEGYVTIVLRKLRKEMQRFETEVSFCCFIVHTLDIYGNKRFSQTFQKEFRDENYESSEGEFEEKYITRNSILNNADEFLRNKSLKFTVDVLFSKWTPTLWGLKPSSPLTVPFDARVFTSLRMHTDSISLSFDYIYKYLYNESCFFRNLCDYTFQDSSKELTGIPLVEYSALRSMLLFIETGSLSLEEVTVCDLYVIADKYDVPRMLDACRHIIKQSLSKENASNLLNFVKPFYDPDLKEAIEKYWNNLPEESENSSTDDEEENDLDDASETLFFDYIVDY